MFSHNLGESSKPLTKTDVVSPTDLMDDHCDVTMTDKKRRLVIRGDSHNPRSRDAPCCSKKCYVVTAVALFLFLTFVALPAGAFLIIHGRHEKDLAFIIGGAAVVAGPVLVGVVLTAIFCVRRRRRSATFTSVSTARV